MSFNFLNPEDIPTKRRLDYILEDMDGFKAGVLYGRFRGGGYSIGMDDLKIFSPNYKGLTDEQKELEFKESIESITQQTKWVNDWMDDHGKLPIFRDNTDWKKVGEDFDYFWMLRTEKQFEAEEAEAEKGKNGRYPVRTHYNKENVKQFLESLNTPSLDD